MVGYSCCWISCGVGFCCFFLPGFIWLMVEVVTRSKFVKTQCEITDKYYVEYLYDMDEGKPTVPPSTTPQYRLTNPINSNYPKNATSLQKQHISSFSPHSVSLENLFGASKCYSSPTDNVVPFFLLKYYTDDGKEYNEYACNFGRVCWREKGISCTNTNCDIRITSKECKNWANLETSDIYEKYQIGSTNCWYSKKYNEYASCRFPLPNFLWSLFFWIPLFFTWLPGICYILYAFFKPSRNNGSGCCKRKRFRTLDLGGINPIGATHQFEISGPTQVTHNMSVPETVGKLNEKTDEIELFDETPPKLTGNEDFETMVQLYRNQTGNQIQNQNQNQIEGNDFITYNYEPKGNDEIPMGFIQTQINEYNSPYNQQEPQTNEQINIGPLYNPYYQDPNQGNKEF
ncbi:hypothetical protein M0811_06073 [Anaeramoeba ignava]|uniref:Uncharacterized protein n=1 Tax=Anaeramoeba ignava TaxID=1746090 RepID=A0A9Q0LS58_ANAIG|nr:hypothetical protein M0811_06073 [Anaeramoeba ignava]